MMAALQNLLPALGSLQDLLPALSTPYARHVLELAMVLPASILCLLPLRGYYAGPRWLILLLTAVEEALVIFIGGRIALNNGYPSVLILAMSIVLFFPSLMLAVQISLPKMIFCFAQAVTLCLFANLVTSIITIPWELDELLTYSPRSSLLCLGVSFILIILFYRTLSVKLPDLFAERQVDGIWFWGILLCVAASGLILWHVQPDDYLLDDGFRTRLIVTLGFVPLTLLMLYQMMWWFARRLRDEANLTQENNLLRMESKRFASLYRYLDETRTLRHDFRQHVRVLTGLARSGKTEELTEYLSSLEDSPTALVRYCLNPTVDALAAHYAMQAEAQATQVDWTLELPEELNMRASDFCSILGNLVENSLQAVGKLPEEQRHISVVARMLSDQMLGLSVENPYLGRVRLRSDGLPAVRRRSHGIGLHSVAATVRKYDGTMDLDVADGVFRVHILMYPHPSPPVSPLPSELMPLPEDSSEPVTEGAEDAAETSADAETEADSGMGADAGTEADSGTGAEGGNDPDGGDDAGSAGEPGESGAPDDENDPMDYPPLFSIEEWK